ncbi:MAG TPA: M23 family metallopeptidase [Gemmatimonadaceae bacterium]|jgi:murein DD-endopeptidase MepM/ murein hydrolase activator NlpD|nr:M23 family metallopeptidase [Gemmatimonadaceae bacterium]
MSGRQLLLPALALMAACRAAPTPAPRPVAATPRARGGDADLEWLRARQLMVPVAGVAPERVPDSYHAARSGDRIHRATDILAPRGTPVLAADDGHVFKVRRNSLGGLTVYVVDLERRFLYYYAHLARYRAGLREGMRVAQGDVIGYVGTTGNAPKNTPHLHFQVMRMRDDRYWDGEPVDARPFLVLTGLVRTSTDHPTTGR